MVERLGVGGHRICLCLNMGIHFDTIVQHVRTIGAEIADDDDVVTQAVDVHDVIRVEMVDDDLGLRGR